MNPRSVLNDWDIAINPSITRDRDIILDPGLYL